MCIGHSKVAINSISYNWKCICHYLGCDCNSEINISVYVWLFIYAVSTSWFTAQCTAICVVCILYIIAKNIRWNGSTWCSLNNTYHTFLTLCIRCTHHLCDSCGLWHKPTFCPVTAPDDFIMLAYCDVIDAWVGCWQSWRHNDRLFLGGFYRRFLIRMALGSVNS